MKNYLLRALFFILFASVLGLISEAGLTIHNGNVTILGRFQVAFNNVNSATLSLQTANFVRKSNRIGVAQAELNGYKNGKPLFVIKKIFDVNTDENGYFKVENVPDTYTYFMIGAQLKKGLTVNIQNLVMVKKIENESKVLNMGNSILNVSLNPETNEPIVSMKVTNTNTNHEMMNYFLSKTTVGRFCSKVVDNTMSCKGLNKVTVASANEVVFSGITNAIWEKIRS